MFSINSFASGLADYKQSTWMRTRKIIDSANQAVIEIQGREFINFSSNNYLDLANHPLLKEAFCEAAERYGMGAGASQFISGKIKPLDILEQELAAFTRRDRVALFSSGYLANLAVVTALADRDTDIVADRQVHASLIDGALLSKGILKRYRHLDVSSAEQQLSRCQGGRVLLLTDGVFSMDGQIAPLPELAKIGSNDSRLLVVDDAHGIGVLGEEGVGIQEYFQMGQDSVPLLIGTFAKSFGLAGAFVAGPGDIVEVILQKGRMGMYTTALMPGIAAAASVALQIIRKETWRRHKLLELIAYFRELITNDTTFEVIPSETPIQAVVTGSNETAILLSQTLNGAGIYAPAIRTPTVPKKSTGVRISLTAGHSTQDVEKLVHSLQQAAL